MQQKHNTTAPHHHNTTALPQVGGGGAYHQSITKNTKGGKKGVTGLCGARLSAQEWYVSVGGHNCFDDAHSLPCPCHLSAKKKMPQHVKAMFQDVKAMPHYIGSTAQHALHQPTKKSASIQHFPTTFAQAVCLHSATLVSISLGKQLRRRLQSWEGEVN